MIPLLAVVISLATAPQAAFAELARNASEAREARRFADAISLYRQGLALDASWAEGWWAVATL